MNRNIKNITEEKIILTGLKKREFFWKILKSVEQNNNIEGLRRGCASLSLKKMSLFRENASKKNKICLYTGHRGGILKGFDFSRYQLKALITKNKLDNFKKNNW